MKPQQGLDLVLEGGGGVPARPLHASLVCNAKKWLMGGLAASLHQRHHPPAKGCPLTGWYPSPSFRLEAEPNNTYRLARVVEILLAAPRARLSDFTQAGQGRYGAFAFHPFFLVRPRLDLYRRIDARVEHMVSSGLIGVRGVRLQVKPGWDGSCGAVGYTRHTREGLG